MKCYCYDLMSSDGLLEVADTILLKPEKAKVIRNRLVHKFGYPDDIGVTTYVVIPHPYDNRDHFEILDTYYG